MKKTSIFFSLAALLFGVSACEADKEGTLAGGDGAPVVTLYQYDVNGDLDENGEPYDADCTTHLRIACNHAVESVVVFSEPIADYKERIKGGQDAYADYAAANGTAVDVKPSAVTEKFIQFPIGEYAITVVNVSKGIKSAETVTFNSVTWTDVREAYFNCNFNLIKSRNGNYKLQQCDVDASKFRIKGVFGIRSLVFTIGKRFSSGYIISIPKQQTGLSYGSYGAVTVEGVDGYCGMYDDNSVAMVLDFTVSAGSFGEFEASFGDKPEAN